MMRTARGSLGAPVFSPVERSSQSSGALFACVVQEARRGPTRLFYFDRSREPARPSPTSIGKSGRPHSSPAGRVERLRTESVNKGWLIQSDTVAGPPLHDDGWTLPTCPSHPKRNVIDHDQELITLLGMSALRRGLAVRRRLLARECQQLTNSKRVLATHITLASVQSDSLSGCVQQPISCRVQSILDQDFLHVQAA